MRPPTSRTYRLAECARIAGAQHGVIGLVQALGAGLSRSSIYRLAATGVWQRLHPGVFRLWEPPTEDDRWRQRLAAAAIWLGERSAASHRAAAIFWDLEGIPASPVELVTTSRRRSSQPGLLIHRVRVLPIEDIAIRSGIPVTSVTRTLVDLAVVLEPVELELALESAIRRRLVSSREVMARLEGTGPTVAGRGVLRSLLEGRPSVATESALETLVWRALLEGGLPQPVPQYEVRDEDGRFVARVDFAYPDARLAIEADGYRFHSGRKQWQHDRARQNRLSRLGWTIYRVTWDEANRSGKALCDAVRDLLTARSSEV